MLRHDLYTDLIANWHEYRALSCGHRSFERSYEMSRRDKILALEPAPRLRAGPLFDERGEVQGWTPAFAGNNAFRAASLAGRTIADFLPEIDIDRWAAIWRQHHDDEVERLCFGRAGPRRGQSEFIEVEVCKFVGGERPSREGRGAQGRRREGELRILQQEILEAMATGVALSGNYGARVPACRSAGAIGHLLGADCRPARPAASSRQPQPPRRVFAAIDGHSIGPKTGSCGTAAFRGEPVEVTDIASDPLWEDFKDLVSAAGAACLLVEPDQVEQRPGSGSLAFYFPVPRRPTALERQIVATCLHICAIALDHEQTRQRIYELAFCDPLTNLDNRIRFQQRVERGAERDCGRPSSACRPLHRSRPFPGHQRYTRPCQWRRGPARRCRAVEAGHERRRNNRAHRRGRVRRRSDRRSQGTGRRRPRAPHHGRAGAALRFAASN